MNTTNAKAKLAAFITNKANASVDVTTAGRNVIFDGDASEVAKVCKWFGSMGLGVALETYPDDQDYGFARVSFESLENHYASLVR